jgi:hypothetical protein
MLAQPAPQGTPILRQNILEPRGKAAATGGTDPRIAKKGEPQRGVLASFQPIRVGDEVQPTVRITPDLANTNAVDPYF